MITAINESGGTRVTIEGTQKDIKFEFIAIVASLIRDIDRESVMRWLTCGENLANNPEWVED